MDIRGYSALFHQNELATVQIFREYEKVIIYALTGAVLPFIVVALQKHKAFKILLYKTNHKSINDNVFDDIIDYDKDTTLQIYLKNSNIYYIGTFKYIEEKGTDSYIVLINYMSLDVETSRYIFDPAKHNFKSTVAICLNDINRIEIIYENDSDVWKSLNDHPDPDNT